MQRILKFVFGSFSIKKLDIKKTFLIIYFLGIKAFFIYWSKYLINNHGISVNDINMNDEIMVDKNKYNLKINKYIKFKKLKIRGYYKSLNRLFLLGWRKRPTSPSAEVPSGPDQSSCWKLLDKPAADSLLTKKLNPSSV